MKRQINTSLYERLLLSKGEINKQEVLNLATKGIELAKPSDMIKDPYVFKLQDMYKNNRAFPVFQS